MKLENILSNTNNEVKNAIIGFALDEVPRTINGLRLRIINLLANSDTPVPSKSTIRDYVDSLVKEGIVTKGFDREEVWNHQRTCQSFSIHDQRYTHASRFLLRLAQEENTSLFTIFGHRKGVSSTTSSSLENRTAILESLYESPMGITELCKELKLDPSVVNTNLQALGKIGYVQGKGHSGIEPDHYKILEDLKGYFISRLPTHAAGIGDGDTLKTFLKGTDRELYRLYSGGKLRKSTSFTSRDIYGMVPNTSRLALRNLFGRMEEQGYLERKARSNGREHSLSGKGAAFWESIIPLKEFFERNESSNIGYSGSVYSPKMSLEDASDLVSKTVKLYLSVSPYLKQENIHSKAEKVMYLLINSKGLSRKQLNGLLDIKTCEAIKHLSKEGLITVTKQGSCVSYAPTGSGLGEYSYLTEKL